MDDNKCKDLLEDFNCDLAFTKLFKMQRDFQIKLGVDYSSMIYTERIKWLKENFIALICEQTELIERLPWKIWRDYSEDEMKIFEEDEIEVFFEWADCLFFLINQALALGIDAKMATNLYLSKYKEDIARIERGYSKNKDLHGNIKI